MLTNNFADNFRKTRIMLFGRNLEESFASLELMFCDLEDNLGNDHVPAMSNKLVSYVHIFNNLIIEAEKKGWSREDIREKITNILRIHDQSTFARDIRESKIKGTFKMINAIIDKIEEAKPNSLGWMIGDYALKSPITQQHREKIKIQSELIKEICGKVKGAYIISIACGSARDIELVQDDILKSGAKIFLLDSDVDALADAKSRLKKIESQIEIVHMNVVQLPRLIKRLSGNNGNKIEFDLIYMGGLFDYLPPRIVESVLKNSSKFMKKNGTLMFTNIADENPYRPWIEIIGDWDLIERTKEDMLKFLAITGCEEHKLFKEPTGLTWIAIASKKK